MSERSLRTPPFVPDGGEAQEWGALPGDDDEVDPRWHEVGPEAEAFAANALDPVTSHCGADLLRHDEAEPRRSRRGLDAKRLRDEEDEVLARRASGPARWRLNALEVGVSPDLTALREWKEVTPGPRFSRPGVAHRGPLLCRHGVTTPRRRATSCTSRRRVACGPYGGGSRALSDHRRSPYGRGSREYGRGGGYGAGTSFSWRSSSEGGRRESSPAVRVKLAVEARLPLELSKLPPWSASVRIRGATPPNPLPLRPTRRPWPFDSSGEGCTVPPTWHVCDLRRSERLAR
jgi:hypothetical protein